VNILTRVLSTRVGQNGKNANPKNGNPKLLGAVILLISVGSLRVQKEAVVEETLSRLLGGTFVRHSTRT